MKAVSIYLFAFATSVAGAPTIITSIPEYFQDSNGQIYRDKRSKFGYYSYGTASSPIASYNPYQWNLPIQGYYNPYNYGYQSIMPGCGRGYRTEDHHNDQEMNSFSDKEQEHSSSRTAMDTAASTADTQITPLSAASLTSIGQLVSPASGPSYGLFPNVQNAGCNVPLLFSCSPSIVPGRIVKASAPMGYGFAPYGYRGVNDMPYDPHTSVHDEQTVHDSDGSAGQGDHVVGHQ